jgi:tRNA (cmo5U34)-methyltransferase
VLTNDTSRTFAAHAGEYDALRRRLIPPYDRFYGTAVSSLGLATRPVARVLDLGAGTGLLSAHVAAGVPGVRLTLVDGAEEMLARAPAVVGDALEATVVGDLRDPLPAGPWDAVVSGLAIHHLADDDKRALSARVFDALEPGGVFVNAEQVLGPTDRLEAAQHALHEADARAAGATDAEWEATLVRMSHDRCAPVEAQLGWLREAGFTDVDAPFRDHRFAVLVGRRPD